VLTLRAQSTSVLLPLDGRDCAIEIAQLQILLKHCRWLKPALVGQFEFVEWTPDGHLRHSRFVGLREDKAARQVGREE
jgi:ATP-dependent DNA ligase